MIIVLISYTAVKAPVLSHGFASYYTSSKLLISGSDPASFYDSLYFYPKMKEIGFGNISDPANIPGGAFIMLPVSLFNPVSAKILWSICSLLFLILSVTLLFKAYKIRYSENGSLVLIIIVLIFYPLYYNLSYGQAYVLILLLAACSIYGISEKKVILTSLPLALLIFIKGYGVLPLVSLLFLKRYKEFFSSVAVLLILTAATLPLFGIDSYSGYYNGFFSVIAFGENASNTAYQTMNSLFGHLLSHNHITNPHALMTIPQKVIYYALQAAGFILLYFVSIKIFRSFANIEGKTAGNKFNDPSLVIFTCSFALNVLFAPAAEDHHSLLYLPLIILSVQTLILNYKKFGINSLPVIFAVLLLSLPLPFRSLQHTEFPLYLTAYPRVYGAIILLIIAIFGFNFRKADFISADKLSADKLSADKLSADKLSAETP